jgi:hypothetical protein
MTGEVESAPSSHGHRSWTDNRLLVALIFLAALASSASQFSKGRFGAGFESVTLARNLAEHGQFASPFLFPTGPSAHLAPLFPAFLALVIWLAGYSPAFVLIVSGCAMLAHALHAALMPAASNLLFADRRPGICAGLLAVPPPVYSFIPGGEAIYCAAGLVLFCLYSDRWLRRGGAPGSLLAGVAMGLLALLNPVSLLVAGPWLLYLLWRAVPRGRTRVCTLVAAGALVALLPWTIRNYHQFHAWFFVRDNLGIELYVSNNDAAQPTIDANKAQDLQALHPTFSPTEAAAVRDLGEVRYNQLRLRTALNWIGSHRTRFIALSLARMRFFWFPDPAADAWHAWAVSSITAASLLGLALLAIRRRPAAPFFAAVFAVYPLLYYFIQSDARYRTPILWLSLLLAGYLLMACWDAVAARR